MRSITVGTDMVSSVISLQKCRPWFMSADEGSNMAADNVVTLKELFADNKTVAMFGVPAPFTGTCTNAHYPPYKTHAESLLKAGADEIVCYSVSDPYAMHAWSVSLGNDPQKIRFLADTDGSFAKAYGVDNNYDAVSLGDRSKRFSMIVKNGHVMTFRIVDDAAKDAETLLAELKEVMEHAE
jgi:glutaredoxin/glutathione-dependent peroxiredoxin